MLLRWHWRENGLLRKGKGKFEASVVCSVSSLDRLFNNNTDTHAPAVRTQPSRAGSAEHDEVTATTIKEWWMLGVRGGGLGFFSLV